MNLTNEQIDAAIAALEAQRVKAAPRQWWGVIDRDDDISRTAKRSMHSAQADLHNLTSNGSHGPYTLVHMREVLP